jgi:cell pole-organizing protein PopZ
MSDERRQQEPTMEEILASIRRIISEDSRAGTPPAAGAAGPGEAQAQSAGTTTVHEAPEFVVRASGSGPDAPIPLTDRSDSTATDAGEPEPLDLTNPLPPAPDRPPASPLQARPDEPMGVLDLTNEVREDISRMEPAPLLAPALGERPDRPAFLSRETHRREADESTGEMPQAETSARVDPALPFGQPAVAEGAPEPTPAVVPQIATNPPSAPEPTGERLISATAEAATASALARLRQAAARLHEPAGPTPEQMTEMLRERVDALLDERFNPALRETLQPALAEHLPAAIREQAAPLVRDRIEPALRDEIVTALNRRMDPLLREQIGPALRERLEPALQERLDPLLRDQLGPALRERLEPALQERLDPLLRDQLGPALRERLAPALQDRLEPLLRERLDTLLREWFDRNLPQIVERIVEREIERLVAQPGGN